MVVINNTNRTAQGYRDRRWAKISAVAPYIYHWPLYIQSRFPRAVDLIVRFFFLALEHKTES